MTIFKTIFKTLNKNASSFTITDESISNNSIFEVYPSDDSVILTDVTVNGTTANITFDSTAEYNIPCAVFINNLIGAYEPESGLPDTSGHAGNILKVNNQLEAYWAIPDSSGIIYKEHSVRNELDKLNTDIVNINEELQEVFQSVSNGKSIIASAITDKGVPTLATDTFQTMADHIAEIEGAGGIVQHEEYYGNAVALYNKTITSQLTGTFRAIIYTYTDGAEVIKKNGITVNAVFSDTRASVHHYAFYEFEVNENDSINFSINNSGDNSFCLGWYITDGTSGGGIDVSDTTATESDVLVGKLFHKANGDLATGTLEISGESKIVSGSVRLTASAGATIETNFKPKLIIVIQNASATAAPVGMVIYDETLGNFVKRNGGNQTALPNTTANMIGSVTNTGFTLNKVSNASTIPLAQYWAIG